MNGILDLGVQVVIFIQGLGSWLNVLMKFFSIVGGGFVFLIVGPLLYWCISTEAGLRLGLMLMLSESANAIIKIFLHAPRPYWYSPEVKALSAEGTFGLPSGHAQRSLVVLGGLADWLKRRWIWVVALALILLIGLSRVYLAVHFPSDVLGGWLIGILLLWSMLRIERRLTGWFVGQAWPVQILSGGLVSLAILGLGIIARRSLGDWQMPATWLVNAARAGGKPPSPLDPGNYLLTTGVFFGMVAGATIQRRWGGFSAASGDLWQKGTRLILGLLGMSILWFGLGLIFPHRSDLLSDFLRCVQSALIGIWFTGLGPETFVRLGLAKRN